MTNTLNDRLFANIVQPRGIWHQYQRVKAPCFFYFIWVLIIMTIGVKFRLSGFS